METKLTIDHDKQESILYQDHGLYQTMHFRNHKNPDNRPMLIILFLILTACAMATTLLWTTASEGAEFTYKEFCNAVYLAEGGDRASKPYGVLSVSCETKAECEQICINSVRNNVRRFNKQSRYTDFVDFFGSRWAPVGADNDPNGLNKNWSKNVRFFLKKNLDK